MGLARFLLTRAKWAWFATFTVGILVAYVVVFRNLHTASTAAVGVHRSVLRHPVRTTDPLLAHDVSSLLIVNNTQDGLVDWVAEKGLQPSLATRWERSEDSRTFDFFLRSGVEFHDGRKLTASDVKRSLTRLVLGGGVYGAYFSAIESMEVVAEDRLRIRLSRALSDFPLLLASSAAKITRLDGDVHLGTGPFKLRSLGAAPVLERFANYWGAKAQVGRVEFQVATPQWARALASQELVDDLAAFAAYLPRKSSDTKQWKEQSQWSTWVFVTGNRDSAFADSTCRAQAARLLGAEAFRSTFFGEFEPTRDLASVEAEPVPPLPNATAASACKGHIRIAVSTELGDGADPALTVSLQETLKNFFPRGTVEIIRVDPRALLERARTGLDSAYLTAITSEVADPSFLSDSLAAFALGTLKKESADKLNGLTKALAFSDSHTRRIFAAVEMGTFLEKNHFIVPIAHAATRSWTRNCVSGIQTHPLSVGHTLYHSVENRCSPAQSSSTLGSVNH